MIEKSAEDIVLAEFACYFLNEEVPDWSADPTGQVLRELADRSARRLARAAGERAAEVIAVLRRMHDDRESPLLDEISASTLIEWRDDWADFQELVSAIIEALQQE
jgi:hypothetical protein